MLLLSKLSLKERKWRKKRFAFWLTRNILHVNNEELGIWALLVKQGDTVFGPELTLGQRCYWKWARPQREKTLDQQHSLHLVTQHSALVYWLWCDEWWGRWTLHFEQSWKNRRNRGELQPAINSQGSISHATRCVGVQRWDPDYLTVDGRFSTLYL